MVNLHHTTLKRIAAWMLLMLFASYTASCTLFYHTHYDASGRKIVHSHIYRHGTASQPGHTHSAGETQAIQQLSLLVYVLAILPLVLNPLVGVRLCRHYSALSVNIPAQHSVGLRGPPVVFL